VSKAIKIAALGFATVFSLLLVVILATLLVLGTERGSRWVLGHVPGLQVEAFEGVLAGHWQARSLIWESAGTRASVLAPNLTWRPSCLWRRTLCIDHLQAQAVAVTLPPASTPTEDSSSGLPDLSLPLALELGDLQIGSVQVDGKDTLQDLRLTAHWQGDGLQIDTAHLRQGDLQLDLTGHLQPGGQWPLQANARLVLPAVDGQDWQLALQAVGELQGKLTLEGQSTGYLAAQLQGEVQPLQANVPAQLQISAPRFKASGQLPDTLALENVLLKAVGDLQEGYRIDGQASLPARQGPVALALRGQVNAQGAKIETLDLTAGPGKSLGLSGQLDWREALSAQARLAWRDFPWQRLYPMDQEPPVALRRLDGEVSYTDGRYLGNVSGDLLGPAGPFSLVTPFSGDLQQIFLPQLEITAGKGKAAGHLNLGFADGIRWDTELALSALDPAYWVADLPGSLAGPLKSKGTLRDGVLAVDADIDLQGRLRGQPAVLQAHAEGGEQRWKLDPLQLRLGDNRISGTASLDRNLAARLNLELPRLAQLWPGLQGQISGLVQASGTLQAPQGEVRLQGQNLAFADNRLQRLNLAATLDARQQGLLELLASRIQAGETAVGDLTVTGRGDLGKQAVQLDLKGPLLKAALGLDGTWHQNNWRGRLATGQIQAGGQDWRLQSAARLERLANGSINFGAHCWRSGQASLCGEDQRLAPEPRLRYHLKDFALQSLGPWLPKDLQWQGQLDADLAVDLPASGPSGQVKVDASGGTLRIRDAQRWLEFPYQALTLTSQLSPRRIDTALDFVGGKLGTLKVQTRLDPLAANKPISGTFALQGLDLSIARPLVTQVEKLSGRLAGEGTVSGDLLAPRINGRLTLSDGEISGGELPTPFQALNITANIAGESLQLDGAWKSGDTGQGTLNGQLSWSDGLAAQLAIKGSRLPVTVEPYALLEAAPDLSVQLKDNRLAIVGKVAVPKGTITVRQLPPSTVKLSEDAVIVGQQDKPGSTPLAMAMDIDVVVGEQTLAFSGFGLTANLAGHVHIGDNLDTRGELSLNDGRYRAYGQRLTIRRARLLFAGPISQPYLDIEAIRQTDDIIAGIRLSGPAEQPNSEVFSEPSMSQEQALSYLVLGRPLSTSGEDNNMLAQAALALGLAGSSSTAGKLASDLGIKDFQLDTQGTGNATSVVASGNLTDKLILRYGVGVFEPANTIALRYLLSKKVYIEAASGVASSLDIFYKRDF
jgi:translocation and assembly module TamB